MPSNKREWIRIGVGLGVLVSVLLVLSSDAFAGDAIFTKFQTTFADAAKGGMSSLKSYAMGVLGSLIVIDFVYVVSNVALGDGLPLGVLFWRFIKWGLFVYFVQEFPTICTNIQDGFLNISSAMGIGKSDMMSNPSGYWDSAGAIYDKIKDNMTNVEMSFPGVLLIMIYLLSILLIYTLFFLLAATIVSATVVFWFCGAIGYCLFPFMVLDQTRMLAGNTPNALIAGAVKLMMVNIVIGIGSNKVFTKLSPDQIKGLTSSSVSWDAICTILSYGVYVLLFFWTSLKVPGVVTASIVGSAGGGLGISGAVTKIGGAAVATAKQAITFGVGMGLAKAFGKKGGPGGGLGVGADSPIEGVTNKYNNTSTDTKDFNTRGAGSSLAQSLMNRGTNCPYPGRCPYDSPTPPTAGRGGPAGSPPSGGGPGSGEGSGSAALTRLATWLGAGSVGVQSAGTDLLAPEALKDAGKGVAAPQGEGKGSGTTGLEVNAGGHGSPVITRAGGHVVERDVVGSGAAGSGRALEFLQQEAVTSGKTEGDGSSSPGLGIGLAASGLPQAPTDILERFERIKDTYSVPSQVTQQIGTGRVPVSGAQDTLPSRSPLSQIAGTRVVEKAAKIIGNTSQVGATVVSAGLDAGVSGSSSAMPAGTAKALEFVKDDAVTKAKERLQKVKGLKNKSSAD